MPVTPGRRPRVDAVRNRAAILDAARQQITAHGPDVAMEQIAGLAGVAVGTLYRHFPTKVDLVAAVVSAFVVEVADHVEAAVARVDDGSPAFVELAGLLRDIIRSAATNHAVKAAARVLNADVGDSIDLQRAHAALQRLIDAARGENAVRDDLVLEDFYLLISHVPDGLPPTSLDRWVDLALFGMAGPAQR